MPLLLHPSLKRGLDYDDYDIDPADTIEHVPRIRPEEQAAKRQRIEKIASQYLRGRVPVISTASLRGPFNDGWKNPWAEGKKPKRKSRGSGGTRQKAGTSGQNGAGRAGLEVRRSTRSASKAHRDARIDDAATSPEPSIFAEILAEHHTPAVARRRSRSPEASRAVHTGIEDLQESHTLDVIEPLPATAPSPDQTPSTADFIGPETTRCVRSRSPMTNPFWLRRPEPSGKFDMRKSTNGTTEATPSHSRSKISQPNMRRTLHLVQPKAALVHRAQPQHNLSPADDIRSSASASMVISSPVRTVTQAGHDDTDSQTLRLQEPPAGTTGPSASTLENAQSRSEPATMPLGTPLAGPGTAEAELATGSIIHRTSQQGSQTSIAREVIQRSAERLVDLLASAPPSAALSEQRDDATKETKQGTTHEVRPKGQHTLVASPAPNCSSGFVYKKVGTKKWTIDNAPRSKPRAVNFNSSQGSKVATRSEPSSQNSRKSDADGSEERPNVAAAAPEEQHSMGSTRSSRQSAMSTQAAMLLAQLEFQESTFPMSSPAVDTPRPWSQPQEETPRPVLPEPSPAITPLSVFKPQLDQAHPMTSVLRGPVMSTQDLFAAASPFAMSTVKKKPSVPERSNLRMSITSLAGPDNDAGDPSSKSPISLSNRVPLAEKNAAPSPWSFGYDKERRSSQESSIDHTRRSFNHVELPQLDFHTSLDGYGSNESFHFADRILRNFNDT